MIFVVSQQFLDLLRITVANPIDPDKVHQVSGAGRDLDIVVQLGSHQRIERVRSQAGQFLLRLLTNRVLLIAELTDQRRDRWLSRVDARLGAARRRGEIAGRQQNQENGPSKNAQTYIAQDHISSLKM